MRQRDPDEAVGSGSDPASRLSHRRTQRADDSRGLGSSRPRQAAVAHAREPLLVPFTSFSENVKNYPTVLVVGCLGRRRRPSPGIADRCRASSLRVELKLQSPPGTRQQLSHPSPTPPRLQRRTADPPSLARSSCDRQAFRRSPADCETETSAQNVLQLPVESFRSVAPGQHCGGATPLQTTSPREYGRRQLESAAGPDRSAALRSTTQDRISCCYSIECGRRWWS